MDGNLIQVSRIHRLDDAESKLKAFVDVNLAGFLIKGLRIVEGKNGLFLGMPRQQGKDGKWYNCVQPATKEIHQELTDFILAAYKE